MNFMNKYNVLLVGNTELEVFFKYQLKYSKYNPTVFVLDNNLSDTELLSFIKNHKINVFVSLSDAIPERVFDVLAKKKIRTIGINEKFMLKSSEKVKEQISKKLIDEELSILYFWNQKNLTHIAITENYKDKKNQHLSNYEMATAFPVNVSGKTSKLIQEHTANLAQVLSKEKANFKGYICSTFSENENEVNFGFKENICLGIAAFSSFFFNNKKDIIDILNKIESPRESVLNPYLGSNITGVVPVYSNVDSTIFENLKNNNIEAYYCEQNSENQTQRVLVSKTSNSPFADIINGLDSLNTNDIEYNKNAGFPYTYNECFCKNLSKDEYPKYLKKIYKSHLNTELDLDNPQKFTEKIQWLKLNDQNFQKTTLSDKILVKTCIKEMLPDLKITKVYGSWDKFDDIDFKMLPETFILKTNHSCKTNIKIFNKSKLLKSKKLFASLKKFYDYHLNVNFAFCSGFELQYKDIKPKVFAEELIGEIASSALTDTDYKIHCFNGTPMFIEHFTYINNFAKIFIADTNWKQIRAAHTVPLYDDDIVIPKPKKFDLMLDYAKKLSKDFKYVRCDFLLVKEDLYFAELTFTPSSGFMSFYPKNIDHEWGKLLKL